ncbi:MAG: DUF2975 domain-containing protein [Parasphingorhabdus sp.]|uniref:DUF2975 domain-containing protein n=1 Tax=Parasphingorhabdus sp. TaxID=2709688 RepID=UPI0032654D03
MINIIADPFLKTGAFALKAGQHLFAIAAALVLLAVPLAVVFSDHILQAVHQHFSIAESHYPVGPVVLLMLLVSTALSLWWMFFRNLANIADTVVKGDPFIASNADRLQRMAFLLLAIQLIYIPTAAFGLIVETAFKGPTSTVDVFWDFTGMLMVITLFVFARVFRQGTDMRSELKGLI